MTYTKEIAPEIEAINARRAAIDAEILTLSAELATVAPFSHRKLIIDIEMGALGKESQRLQLLIQDALADCDDSLGGIE